MTVKELIAKLQDMPHNAPVKTIDGENGEWRAPRPEMEWNDHTESYLVVI